MRALRPVQFTFLHFIILVIFGKLGRPKRRWKDNIRMDFREVGWEGVDGMDPAQDTDH